MKGSEVTCGEDAKTRFMLKVHGRQADVPAEDDALSRRAL